MEKLVPKLGTKWIKLCVSIIVNILINSYFSDGTSAGAEIETVYWSYWHISKDYTRLEIQKPKCYNNKRKKYIINLYCLASVNEPYESQLLFVVMQYSHVLTRNLAPFSGSLQSWWWIWFVAIPKVL